MIRRNKDTWTIIMYNHWKDMNTPALIINKEMIIVARSDCKQKQSYISTHFKVQFTHLNRDRIETWNKSLKHPLFDVASLVILTIYAL